MRNTKTAYKESLTFLESALTVVLEQGYNDTTKAFDALERLDTKSATVNDLNKVFKAIWNFMEVDFGYEALKKIDVDHNSLERHFQVIKEVIRSRGE